MRISPAVPRTIAAASAKAPLAPNRPSASTNRRTAATFGPIAGRQGERAQLVGGGVVPQGARLLGPPALVDAVDVGEQEQPVGVETSGENRGGQILVDRRYLSPP
jgi:hypothetical protein